MSVDFWNAKLVSEHLVQAFRVFPGAAVYSARGTIRPGLNAAPATADAFSWASRFLVDHPKARLHLFAYCRCRATKESWRDLCRQMGWPSTTADMSKALAAKLIAEGLNREAAERHAQYEHYVMMT